MTASITAPRRPFFFQHPHALDGAAAGAAHGVLECAGVLAALKHQLRTAQDHLGGVLLRLGTGQAAGHAAVGQRLDELVHPGRAAAGHAAGRVDEAFRHSIQPPGGGHQLQELGLFLGGDVGGAVLDHTGPPTEAGVLGMMRMTGQSLPAIS